MSKEPPCIPGQKIQLQEASDHCPKCGSKLRAEQSGPAKEVHPQNGVKRITRFQYECGAVGVLDS